jgi:hypothetical protein
MIMKGRAPLRLPWAGILTIGLMAAATLPAWATGDQQKPAQSREVIATKVEQVKPEPRDVKIQTPHHALPVVIQHDPKNKQLHVIEIPKPAVVHNDKPMMLMHQDQKKPAPVWEVVAPQKKFAFFASEKELTEEGQKLLKNYEADRDAIQAEIAQKLEARRAQAIKQLEALQEQYTKAGKLDEAVAIRDYLRAGGPHDSKFATWIKR